MLPLCFGNQIIGSLNFSSKTAHAYSIIWRNLASLLVAQLAGQLGSILAHERTSTALYALQQFQLQVQQQTERERLLGGIALRIRQSLELSEILKAIVREVRQFLNTDRVVIYQFNQDWEGQVIVEEVMSPWPSTLGDTGQDNCFSQEYAHLYASGRVRAISDIDAAGLDTCHVKFLRSLKVRANLIVPILIGSRLWGLLVAHECSAARLWQDSEIDLLQRLADHIGIAISQAELHAQIQASAAQFQGQAERLRATLEELQAAQTQLIQSEKMSSLGQMVAGVAHEINNPINFIHANLPHAQEYVEILEQVIATYAARSPEPPAEIVRLNNEFELDYIRQDFPKLLKSMREGTERVRDIVRTLRNFSRLDQAQRKSVDLHEGLESSLLLLQYRFKPSVKLTRRYSALPLVECYAGQINQVFMNLLSNALDASVDAGADSVELTVTTLWSEPDWVSIAIRDNGPGIPAAIRDRIFDPFFTTKEVGKGTGLGLSICYKIVVEEHKGRIECFSEPGKGTEFRIHLPLRA
ncbi:GAF domain-containing sensor histidine kinase [Leptolyngbya sp. FACHB-261]|nr:GAF domain-containing sensor histidine kinase [Leptolyngbya sp. FACHB-261]